MKYFPTLLFFALSVQTALLLQPAASCAEEKFTPLAVIFDGKPTAKFLVCAGYPQGDSYEDTLNACSEKIRGSYVIFNADGNGYLASENNERHKARFTWSKDEGSDGSISVIRGARELGYVFYRNKYANGYGSADCDLPLALEKE